MIRMPYNKIKHGNVRVRVANSTLLTHFLSCIIVLSVSEITRIPPALVYELFQSFHNLSFLGRNCALNSNRNFVPCLLVCYKSCVTAQNSR